MTFKQLLDKVTYPEIAPYIRQCVADNEHDLRPEDVKQKELEEGFEAMKTMKPTFGFIDSRIEVKLLRGRLNVSNMHLGSTTDLLSHQISVAPDVKATEQEIAAQCVFHLIAHESTWQRYRDEDDFDDMENLQAARCLR